MSSLTKPKQVPPNIRRIRGTSKAYTLPIKERQEEYIRTLNEQTRPFPSTSVPSAASTNPHDMNKQAVLSSQPQVAHTLYGSVSNQHTQSGMLGANHGSSSTLAQPPQGQLQGRNQSQSNMQPFFNGRSNASANYGISRNPGMTVAASAISSNAHYTGQLAMYTPSQNPYSSTMIIPSVTHISYPQNQYPTQYPQHNIPNIYRGGGGGAAAAAAYFNSTGTVYYPSPVNMAVSRANMNTIGTANTTAPPPKREKKIITISDDSGRDLTEEILSTAKNETVSSNSSSQANLNEFGQNSVAAQFAEQVAAAVKGPSKTPPLIPVSQASYTVTDKNRVDSSFRDEAHQFESDVKRTILNSQEGRSKTPPPLISPNQITNCIGIELHLQEQEVENLSNEKPETFLHTNHIDCHESSSSKAIGNSIENDVQIPVSTESSSKPISALSATEVVDISAVVEKPENTNSGVVFLEVNGQEYPEPTEDTSKMLQPGMQNGTDSIPVLDNEDNFVSVTVQNNVDVISDVDKSFPPQCESKEAESPVSNSKEETVLSTGETDTLLANINDVKPSEEKKENDAIPALTEAKQEVKERKNKGKKRKEINKRGETKEGDDMDAFVDKPDAINQSLSASSTSPVCTSPIPEMVFTSSRIDTVDTMSEEERRVAEKNEENKRVCMEAENSIDKKEVIDLIPCRQDSSLKYNYSEDQWSPINQEGKKKYDRDFLLLMQREPLCLQKPKNLPEVEIVKDKAVLQKLPESIRIPVTQFPNRPDPFMPNFARSSRPPPGGVNRRQSQQGKEKVKRVINMPGSLTQDVKLHACDNAWKAGNNKKNTGDNDSEETETKELYKKVTGILNKLTPQKFHTLVEQTKHLNIDTEARLTGVMDLVFEKAVDEPNFSVPYANMCKQIALIKVPKVDATGNDKEKDVNFKKLLLMKCQREFEKDNTDEIKSAEKIAQIEKAETDEQKKQLQEELDEEERKSRHRSLGNIKFIGELFKLNMLTAPIMHECMRKLVRQGDDDSLECLCRLLTTIGKELDPEKSKQTNQKLPSMDTYFDKMKSIVDERKTSSRVRFMLQDVIELKQNNWVPRRDENNPKTIDQIHREAEREAQQQQQLLQQTTFSKRPPDDRNAGRKNRNNPAYSDDGWSTHKNKTSTIDLSKLKISKSTNVDACNVQLGHGFAKWGQGSSGGQVKTAKQDGDNRSAVFSQNRYSALLVDQNPPSYESRRGSQRSTASSRESSRSGTSNLPPPPVRKTSSQTSTKERKQAVVAVKDITRNDTQKQKISNAVQKQEFISKEQNTVLQGPELTEEVMETKTKTLIDEFLHNNDFKEATVCVIETVSLSTAPVFISAAISHVLERSSQGRRLVGQLIHQLIKKKIIPMDFYVAGLKSVLETADDCAIDVPKIWQYLGELIEPMVQDNTISLAFLKDAAQPCVASGTGGKLISEVLHAAAKHQGSIRVAELWKVSGLQWSDFLSKTENVSSFVKQNNLEFTTCDLKMEAAVEELSLDTFKTELDNLLKREADNEAILDWIVAHVRERVKDPKFTRALTTSLVESAIKGEVSISSFDKKKLLPRVPLLQKYMDQNVDLELQAVFALQTLVNRLEHPKGLLRELFEFFFDEDLISEDAFTRWEQNSDPAEQEGKGVALKSVTSFMTWLREQDDSSLEDN